MKIITSDKFERKFKTLSIEQMDTFFGYIHNHKDWPVQFFIKKAEVKLIDGKDKIYIFRVGDSLRVFFTVIREVNNESLLLLDILTHAEVTP